MAKKDSVMIFERTEKKYRLNQNQFELLRELFKQYTIEDEYGRYTICNVYFDNDTNDLIIKSLAKPKFKQKLRLRSYGVPTLDQKVFFEIKKKYDGVVYKRRIKITMQEFYDYNNKGIPPAKKSGSFDEIDYFKNKNNLKPKLYLAYDRIALKGKDDSNLRITFDMNIRSRWTDVDLMAGDYGDLLLPEGEYIMEIKVNNAMPKWLVDIINVNKIYPVSFSKYGEIYKKYLSEKNKNIQ